MNHQIRRVSTAVCAAVLLLAGIQRSMAQTDPPGNPLADGQTQNASTTPALSTDTDAGAQPPLVKLATETMEINNDPNNTVQSWVYTDDKNNPYGLGFLTFKYVISLQDLNGVVGPNGITTFQNAGTGGWGGFLTSVGENNASGGASPNGYLADSVSRSANGDVITWDWSPGLTSSTGSGAAQGMSAVLIIETDATSYANTTFEMNDPTASVTAYIATPDGGMTLALLGGALVGIQSLRRKLEV
jgi:hypothetical protein